jgi:hypothetical protein
VLGNRVMCTCIDDYLGDPQAGCHPECTIPSDCPDNRACLNQKCRDPCPGTCGLNAQCQARNHVANCICPEGFMGNAFIQCLRKREYNFIKLFEFDATLYIS